MLRPQSTNFFERVFLKKIFAIHAMNTPVIIILLLSFTLNTFSKKDVDNFLKNIFCCYDRC